MNFHRSSRFSNPLMTLIAIVAIFILMAFSIQLLSDAFQFVESLLASSGRQAEKFVTVMSINR